MHLLFTGPEKENLMKQPWFIGLLISIIGVTLWFALCIFVVWLCKKRKAMKKQKMQEMYSGKSPKRKDIKFFPSFFHLITLIYLYLISFHITYYYQM